MIIKNAYKLGLLGRVPRTAHFYRYAALSSCLVLTGCFESGPSLQEVANATGYSASQMQSLSCSQARDKPGHVCSYEYQGRMQTVRLVKVDGGGWRYVEQLDR